jgi:drug/metabolite transporter (DMT)-like permease
VIFGLGAALGWGLADLWAAMSGRRIGALATVLLAHVTASILTGALAVAAGVDLSGVGDIAGWLLPNALVMAVAYFALYRGLALGPVAVVSPILATYAILPVLLAVAILDESLPAIVVLGIGVTIAGAALTSTDLREIRGGSRVAPGLPWAVASALLFGFGTYVFGWASKEAGWLPTLLLMRLSTTALFLVAGTAAAIRGGSPGRAELSAALPLTVAIGIVDMLGAVAYAVGADLGFIAIVTAASATYPIVPVLGGMRFLRERPAPNQLVGVGLVVGGLLAVGLG